MDASAWIALAIGTLTVFLSVGGAIATATWGLGKIQSEAQSLGSDIRSLGKAVDGLRDWLQRLDEKVDSHRDETVQRLTRMEAEICKKRD